MVSCLDHHVGRVLDKLDATGLASNTYVVFTADHGDFLGDHGFVGKGYHFESALRVPLIVAGPAVAEGQRCSQPASTVDIAPTLLDLVGVGEPVGVQGVSQAPYLRGASAYTRGTAMVENDDDLAGEKIRTLVTRDWKLTRYVNRDYGELYSRRDDPHERRNRWSDPSLATLRAELREMLLDEVLCALDILPPRVQRPAPPPKKWTPRTWRGIDSAHRSR